MLIFVLIVSVVQLLLVLGLVYRKSDTSWPYLIAAAPLPLNFCVVSIVLFFQPIGLLALTALHYRFFPDRFFAYVGCCLIVFFAIFGVAFLDTWSIQSNLTERFPMESMANRVPPPKFSKPQAVLPADTQWTSLEERLDSELELENNKFWSRSQKLRQLHENTTDNFINSPGFGVTRMTAGSMSPERFEYRPDEEFVPPEPLAPADPAMLSAEHLEKPYAGNNLNSLSRMHFDGLWDFINFKGFGYVKDREHVAGFYPHQFSRWPKSAANLQPARIELVGLLMHDEPVVYVSDQLPRMKDLKGAPTRTLSDFELKGLEALRNGEDLFVRETPSGALMLGAIRSVSQCLKCHGGERGDLLGAFSYSLRRMP